MTATQKLLHPVVAFVVGFGMMWVARIGLLAALEPLADNGLPALVGSLLGRVGPHLGLVDVPLAADQMDFHCSISSLLRKGWRSSPGTDRPKTDFSHVLPPHCRAPRWRAGLLRSAMPCAMSLGLRRLQHHQRRLERVGDGSSCSDWNSRLGCRLSVARPWLPVGLADRARTAL